MPELIIVLLVIAILVTLALPQIVSSRRLFRFSAMQRQVAASLTDARQEAMSQRLPVTFRYNNATKQIIIYGAKFGAVGDSKNMILEMSGSGLVSNDIVYGRPTGASTTPLGDGTNMSSLTASSVDVTFQPDGSVLNASNNPQNSAMFFYHSKHPKQTAFAISVLGAGGRVKVWRYNQATNKYVE